MTLYIARSTCLFLAAVTPMLVAWSLPTTAEERKIPVYAIKVPYGTKLPPVGKAPPTPIAQNRSEILQRQIQMHMDRPSQDFSTMSNILKTQSTTSSNITKRVGKGPPTPIAQNRSEILQRQIQMHMDRPSQDFSTMSNIRKTQSTTSSNITKNIK